MSGSCAAVHLATEAPHRPAPCRGHQSRPHRKAEQGRPSPLSGRSWVSRDRDGSAASRFFTADAELTFSRRTFRGTGEIDGVYGDRAARGPRVSRHLVTNLHVLRHESDAVDAVSALVLYAQDGTAPIATTAPVLVADVFDRFVRVGQPDGQARWLIASRRIENRFLAPGDVLAVPTT